MQTVKIKANAKLNLALEVVGKFHDGYHNIDTLFASVSVFDTLTVTKAASKRNTVIMRNAPHIAANSAQRAADLFVEEFGTDRVEIAVEKGIPVAGGMGGSSADAAGVIAGMCELYGIPRADALHVAAKLGSDTRFMAEGGFARGQGRGELLAFFNAPNLHFAVITAPVGLLTADVYREFDIITDSTSANVLSLIKKLRQRVVPSQKEFINNLQTAALRLSPEIKSFYAAASKIAPVTMTGSGSCFFAVCKSEDEAKALCGKFNAAGISAFHCETCGRGIEIL